MRNKKYGRIAIYVLFFALTIFLVYEALVTQMPGLWQAFRSGNEAEVERYLSESGKLTGLIFLGLLQFVQVISIVLPGAPVQIAGGMVYGALKAYLVCHFMYISANVAVMTAVRKFSGLSDLLGSSNKDKTRRALEFINKGDPLVTVALLCMLPLVPNGIVPYAASQMDIRIKGFAGAVAVGSFYPILSVVLAGRFIVTGDYLVSILLVVTNIALVIVMYINRERLSKAIQKRRNRK